ncbi:hypothetical protein [Streptomyces sp. NBC_01618]|nr:hypothetical protein OH735_20235 [Streptomyces sp. NBC_01618]
MGNRIVPDFDEGRNGAGKGKEGTESVPFHQTLILQNQLLG